jgi:hypothetical protein
MSFMCDFVHRGVIPPRIPSGDRSDLVVLIGRDAAEDALELVADL